MGEEDVLTIREVADKFGITLRAIRFYEQRGLLKVRRSADGTRFFDPAAVARLSEILELKEQGLTLTQIQDAIKRARGKPPSLTREQMEAQLQYLRDQRAKLDGQIDALMAKLTPTS